ncbi:transposable element Tcb2 transposase [Trichonephila clavipes]|nr:transposable element Tcb2 transposase [Trichonephila clavipes]
MVWGGISIGGHTDLHIIRNGTLTGRRMIMPDRIELFWWRTCLKLKQYSVWNGQRALPDLNPIKHVWDMLGRRIAARPRPPATVRDLEIALLEEWNSIPQSLIDNLIASMANRCAAVLAVRGDHTPY